MRIRTLILGLFFLIVLGVSVASVFVLKGQSTSGSDSTLDKAHLIYTKAKEFSSSGKTDKAMNAFNVILNEYPGSVYAKDSTLSIADTYYDKKDFVNAKKYYSSFLKDFPDEANNPAVRSKLEKIDLIMMKEAESPEDIIEYEVVPGDSLYVLAKKFNTTVELIKKMNSLQNDMIRVGDKLKITRAEFSIFVDKSENILILKKNGKPFKTYTVATGRNNSTPVGVFTVVGKMVKPAWTKPGVGIILPDDEEYELGERWIPISKEGYGIHGTNDASSIGGQTTSGCVRMFNRDVIELYDYIPVGVEVEIVD